MCLLTQSLTITVKDTKTFTTLESIFQRSIVRIDAAVQGLQDYAQLSSLRFELASTSILSSPGFLGQTDRHQPTQLPCIALPTAQNPRFFGRRVEMSTIDKHLGQAAGASGLRSLALHGMGGVGKSQTALAYAHSKTDGFDAILWLHTEAEIALSTSLGEIARDELKIPQAEGGSNADNARLTLNWLQNTGIPIS